MLIPLQITWRGLDASPAIEADIEKQTARLMRFHPRITSCHVAVEVPHHHHHKGNLFRVRVEVVIPGAEVIVGHEPLGQQNQDVYVAIRDAFNAAARRLEDALRRPRGERHPHEGPLRGHVTSLAPDHGFLITDDGLDVYFHRNSVLDQRFERLEVGDSVRVVVADTESMQGPQATTVELLAQH